MGAGVAVATWWGASGLVVVADLGAIGSIPRSACSNRPKSAGSCMQMAE